MTNLTIGFGLFVLLFQGWLINVVIRSFPVFSFFLACFFQQHDDKMGQAQTFCPELEGGRFWEAWRRARYKRNKLISLASKGSFLGSQVLALVIGWGHWQGTSEETTVLVFGVLAFLATTFVLRHKRGHAPALVVSGER